MLSAISETIDRLTGWVGRMASWAILAAVIISAGNAVSRKFFSLSSNAWLELQWYLFGCAFLLTAAWALRNGEHVRVELLNARFSPRLRAWIDLFGHLFLLLPFVLVMTGYLIGYVAKSYRAGEYSSSVGGLILWPAKALLLCGFALLTLQALSELIKTITSIRTGHFERQGAVSAKERAEAEAREAAAKVRS